MANCSLPSRRFVDGPAKSGHVHGHERVQIGTVRHARRLSRGSGWRQAAGDRPGSRERCTTHKRAAAGQLEVRGKGARPQSEGRGYSHQPVCRGRRSDLSAEEYIRSVQGGWRNAVNREQWRNSLRDHAPSLSGVTVDQVNTEQVLAVLRPIWQDDAETAKLVQGRIERILDAAKARRHRPTRLDQSSSLTRSHVAAAAATVKAGARSSSCIALQRSARVHGGTASSSPAGRTPRRVRHPDGRPKWRGS